MHTMAAPAPSLHSAFATFFDATAAARLAVGTAQVQRALRLQAYPEERIMERFLDRGLTLKTAVQEALTWIDCTLPEARDLHDEWVEYKRRLSAYPAVRAFFRGHDYDPLYADRCYAKIPFVMLDDNMFWRATQPFPPDLPPTLRALADAIFDMDTQHATKKRRTAPPPSDPTLTTVVAREEDLVALRSTCMDGFDNMRKDALEKRVQHAKKLADHAAKFDDVFHDIHGACKALRDAREGLQQLLAGGRRDHPAEYVHLVFSKCKTLLAEIAFKEKVAETSEWKWHDAPKPPLVDDNVFRFVRQTEFEKDARDHLDHHLHAAQGRFRSAHAHVLSEKAKQSIEQMERSTTEARRTLGPLPGAVGDPGLFVVARDAFAAVDAVMIARGVWNEWIKPDPTIRAPKETFDAVRHAKIHDKMDRFVLRLDAGGEPELREAATTYGKMFLRRIADARADVSRLIVNDARGSNAIEFLDEFIGRLEGNILPSLQGAQAKSAVTFAAQTPCELATPAAIPPSEKWTVDLAAFKAYRQVLIDTAKALPAPADRAGESTTNLVEVLRMESMGRGGDAPTFDVVWKATTRLWSLLLLTPSS